MLTLHRLQVNFRLRTPYLILNRIPIRNIRLRTQRRLCLLSRLVNESVQTTRVIRRSTRLRNKPINGLRHTSDLTTLIMPFDRLYGYLYYASGAHVHCYDGGCLVYHSVRHVYLVIMAVRLVIMNANSTLRRDSLRNDSVFNRNTSVINGRLFGRNALYYTVAVSSLSIAVRNGNPSINLFYSLCFKGRVLCIDLRDME